MGTSFMQDPIRNAYWIVDVPEHAKQRNLRILHLTVSGCTSQRPKQKHWQTKKQISITGEL